MSSYDNYQGGPQGKQKSGKVVPGFVCSLVGLICCAPVGVVGFILSIIGLNEVNRDELSEGKGLAIAGVVLGGLSLLLLIVSILLFALMPNAGDFRSYLPSNLRGAF